ncbi:GspH/FimT family pseudopilin [Paralysiella testudinis]|uniref:Type II secretion system protein H n=1 Tax=Paralysiella testudinis TaxID=2809020 RepID=A0A892ZDW8_9NEIS|nr:GspH/FimT family pseudopilin [Paralysiella testudinis]QRQ80698.1 GspH/FimT family pseudopilin [Paralysiella testudinis]
MNKNSKQHGFTLIELMVTIAILAIMAAIALPNMSEFLNTRRVANRADQVANLFRFARTEAARLNLPVVVCYSDVKADGKADNPCTPASATNERGMSAFAIRGNLPYNTGRDELLRSTAINQGNKNVDVVFSHITFVGTVNAAAANNNILVFYPNGTFGYMNSNSGSVYGSGATVASGLVRFQFRDDLAADDAAKNRRSTTLLIDAGGRVSVCPKSNAPAACTAT